MDRRSFVKSSALAGLGSSLSLPSSLQAQPFRRSKSAGPKSVIVAGAGIGGLCCGYELMKLGHDVTVLEASGRHGGHVFTLHDGLSDGLYADLGAEHITKPGYDRFWAYTREFDLTVLPYPRRKDVLRRIDGKFYTEEMLSDPTVLKKMGFNPKEVNFLKEHAWWDLRSLYTGPYLDAFTDEYQPFGAGFDDKDGTPIQEWYKKDGASEAALARLGGANTSVLYQLWHDAILKLRGVPLAPPDVHRIKGGNQTLPNEFAKRLGDRVKLNSEIKAIRHDEGGVEVVYESYGEEKTLSADYLANCIPLPAFSRIPVEPAFPADKQYVVNNVQYGTYVRIVFQAAGKFWEDDGLSINMDLGDPNVRGVWQVADEVDTQRVALMGTGPSGLSPQRAVAAFKAIYPGKNPPIEHAFIQDWPKQQYAPTCERESFPMNTLNKFWPHVMAPHGRIHFAGAYADNLNWGMEAATRSANRVAKEIDAAV